MTDWIITSRSAIDICLIPRTSGGGEHDYGVIGIWYYVGKEDLEGKSEPLWYPSDVWKYKINMNPLIKEFSEPFSEDFSKEV